MQIVEAGPELPHRVLAEQENGRLVFFCGAGISMQAQLPSFRALTTRLFDDLLFPRLASDELAIERGQFDSALQSLQNRAGHDRLRERVRDILRTPDGADLTSHRALVDLSTDRSGRVKLVTTNMDRLFEEACPAQDVRTAIAPRLPIPKPEKWNAIVHLHGRIDDLDDPEGHSLVLTSADFGAAYLTERWASRFVCELFSHFTVIFAGYSLSDPVLRYLTDALAADRSVDEGRSRQAYALVGHDAATRDSELSEWRARGIEPLLYDNADHHRVLHDTLRGWARLWVGGLTTRLNVITDLVTKSPASLTVDQRSQFTWALSEPSGAGARRLVEINSRPTAAWLQVLLDAGMLSNDVAATSGQSAAILHRQWSVGEWAPLDPLRRALASWLATGMNDPEVARWVVSVGGAMHPDLAQMVRLPVDDDHRPRALKQSWLALSRSGRARPTFSVLDQVDLVRRVASDGWSAGLRAEVLEALSPRLRLRPSITHDLQSGADSTRELQVSDILSFECELAGESPQDVLLESLRKRAEWPEMLGDLAFDLTCLLRSALDQQAALDGASSEHDWSYLHYPAIAPVEDDEDPSDEDGWRLLIALCREAFDALHAGGDTRAKRLVDLWLITPYPVFRRLVLYAVPMVAGASASEVLAVVVSDPRRWLWSPVVAVELLACVEWLWQNAEAVGRDRLALLLSDGPPRDMFRADLGDEEWGNMRDRIVWDRLARMSELAGEPGLVSAQRDAIAGRHPEWRQEKLQFHTWATPQWGHPSDFSPAELAALSDEKLGELLKTHQENRPGLLEAWRKVVEADPDRAVRVLGELHSMGYDDHGVWAAGLGGLQQGGEKFPARSETVGILEMLPAQLLQDAGVLRTACDAVNGLGKATAPPERSRLLEVWDRLIGPALNERAVRSTDRLTEAINSSAGVLAEALLSVLTSGELRRDKGIAEDVRGRMDYVIESRGTSAPLARAVLMSRLPLLHDLDSDWSHRRLVPLLDWGDTEEASGAWQGLLWSPWLRPSLWRKIKPHFVESFDHLEALDRYRDTLVDVFASTAIEGEGTLAPLEVAECLRKLSDEGRARFAFWIQRRLEGAGEQAAMLWRERIGPWLDQAWPPEPLLRGPKTSERMAWAIMHTGEAFPEAVERALPRLAHAEHSSVIYLLNKGDIPAKEPEASLALVNAMTGDRPQQLHGLRRFLDAVAGAREGLITRPEYRRLDDIAKRFGS